MPSFYAGFDLLKILTDGKPERQAGETVDVYNETDSVSLGTLETDDFGNIPSGSFAIAAGKVVKFSVSGYAPVLRRTTKATAEEAHLGLTEVSLIIDDDFTPTTVEPALIEVYVKPTNEAEVQLVGKIPPGGTLKVPYNPALDDALDIRAISKGENKLSDVFDLNQAFNVQYAPNRETGTPNFSQNGAAANLQINFLATGYSVAKFRKIQYATNSGFTTGLVEKIDGSLTQDLPPGFNITRPGPAASTLAVYVRIKHSTTNQNFDGPWSETKTATFADSGGAGGSGAGNPPTGLSASLLGGGVYQLNWTAGSGTNSVYMNGALQGTGSGFWEDTLLTSGWYTFYVSNADGATNEVGFYYSGFEY